MLGGYASRRGIALIDIAPAAPFVVIRCVPSASVQHVAAQPPSARLPPMMMPLAPLPPPPPPPPLSATATTTVPANRRLIMRLRTQVECDRYEAKIASYGGIELFLGEIYIHALYRFCGVSAGNRLRRGYCVCASEFVLLMCPAGTANALANWLRGAASITMARVALSMIAILAMITAIARHSPSSLLPVLRPQSFPSLRASTMQAASALTATSRSTNRGPACRHVRA